MGVYSKRGRNNRSTHAHTAHPPSGGIWPCRATERSRPPRRCPLARVLEHTTQKGHRSIIRKTLWGDSWAAFGLPGTWAGWAKAFRKHRSSCLGDASRCHVQLCLGRAVVMFGPPGSRGGGRKQTPRPRKFTMRRRSDQFRKLSFMLKFTRQSDG